MTLAKLEASLRDFSREIGVSHAKLTARLIHDGWKRHAPEPQFVSKKEHFAGIRLDPVDPASKMTDAIRIKTKVRTLLPRGKRSNNA
jgi:hypothetical protein